jgi:hypothetical protein
VTDKVFPSPDRDMTTKILGQIMEYAGGSDPGWVVPSGTAKIADSARNGFGETSSGGSLDVEIDTGEAFVQGCWIDRDTTTTVTLAASTADQTVYVGLDLSMKNTVILGLSSDFTADDPKMAIWTYDTDGSGVTSTTDERYTSPGRGLDVPEADNADTLDDRSPGNSSGNIPVSNGTVNTNLNADKLDGNDASNSSGDIPISNGTVNTNLNADKLDGKKWVSVASGNVNIGSDSETTIALNSGGQHNHYSFSVYEDYVGVFHGDTRAEGGDGTGMSGCYATIYQSDSGSTDDLFLVNFDAIPRTLYYEAWSGE